ATSNIKLSVSNIDPVVINTLDNVVTNDASVLSIATKGAFSDPDGDTLTYSLADAPAGLTINTTTGVISGTVDKSASQGGEDSDGLYTITVTANDNQGGSVDTTFTLTVNNPVPVVTPLPGETAKDGEAVNIAAAGAFA